MSGDRAYPDEPVGPFAEPPLSFEDREGRTIEIRSYPPGSTVPEALVEMYLDFDPADRAQGIPPAGEELIREWLETVFAEGHNAVARHGDRAVGHATLVPEAGGKSDDAGGSTAGGSPGSSEAGGSTAGGAPGSSDAGDGADGDDGAGEDTALARPHELAIFVLQEYQRGGIGTRLLEALLGFGAAAGIERVWLTVERWNQPALRLYESVGFEVASDRGSFEVEMSIRLS